CSDKLGLSLELGSFAAGVMISTTDHAHHTLEQVEPIRNFFAALFLASIGMLIHVKFLWNHIDILLAAVILVVVIKTFVVATVVKGFGYTNNTALLGKLYLLLLGTTALSLVTTPFLFKLIPAVVHLGVLLRWFSPELPTENGLRRFANLSLFDSESYKLRQPVEENATYETAKSGPTDDCTVGISIKSYQVRKGKDDEVLKRQ
ncbi:K(+) efflux antiporter 4, partial [Tanacetum coccineum]